MPKVLLHKPLHEHANPEALMNYHTCAIITRGLYIFYPILKGQKCFFKELFFVKFCPYVRLVFKSGL